MKLLPLSAYLSGEAYQPPKGNYQEENNYVPVNKILSLDPVTFFSKANALMESNPPSAADAELLEKLTEVFQQAGSVELFRRADRGFRYGICLPCAGGDRRAWGKYRGDSPVSQDG